MTPFKSFLQITSIRSVYFLSTLFVFKNRTDAFSHSLYVRKSINQVFFGPFFEYKTHSPLVCFFFCTLRCLAKPFNRPAWRRNYPRRKEFCQMWKIEKLAKSITHWTTLATFKFIIYYRSMLIFHILCTNNVFKHDIYYNFSTFLCTEFVLNSWKKVKQ